jgi:hypothetical protein
MPRNRAMEQWGSCDAYYKAGQHEGPSLTVWDAVHNILISGQPRIPKRSQDTSIMPTVDPSKQL